MSAGIFGLLASIIGIVAAQLSGHSPSTQLQVDTLLIIGQIWLAAAYLKVTR